MEFGSSCRARTNAFSIPIVKVLDSSETRVCELISGRSERISDRHHCRRTTLYRNHLFVRKAIESLECELIALLPYTYTIASATAAKTLTARSPASNEASPFCKVCCSAVRIHRGLGNGLQRSIVPNDSCAVCCSLSGWFISRRFI